MIIPVINQDKNIQSECTPIRSKRPLDPSQFSAVPRVEVSKVVGKQKLSNENEPHHYCCTKWGKRFYEIVFKFEYLQVILFEIERAIFYTNLH